MNRDVIVVLESSEDVNRGLLAEGGRIAKLLGGKLLALSGGDARSIQNILLNTPFRLLLFAHTTQGSELAPLIAQSLNAPAVMNCFDIRFRNDNLYYARYVYDGQLEQEVSFANPPEIVTLNPDSLEKRYGVSANIIQLQAPEDADERKTIATIPPDFKTLDIRYAKRILDIGAGCDHPELLKLAEELSNLLEASIGTTRLMVDNGSISKTRMIGQTGKTVSPEFCLALGASGSPHHIAGFQKAGTIFAVNSDERAAILETSDTGFVTDLKCLLPKLVDRIKQYRDEGVREKA